MAMQSPSHAAALRDLVQGLSGCDCTCRGTAHDAVFLQAIQKSFATHVQVRRRAGLVSTELDEGFRDQFLLHSLQVQALWGKLDTRSEERRVGKECRSR